MRTDSLAKRREFLRLASALPLSGLLGSCGGGGSSNDEASAAGALGLSATCCLVAFHAADSSVIPLTGPAIGLEPSEDHSGIESATAFAFADINPRAETGPLPAGLDGDVALTLWLRTDNAGPMQLLRWLAASGEAMSIDLLDAGAGLSLRRGDASAPEIALGPAHCIADGQWHLLVVQQHRGRLQVRIDDRDELAADVALGSGLSGLVFGGNATRPFLGSLDAVQLYGYALSDDRVRSMLAHWQLVSPSIPSVALLGWFPLAGNVTCEVGTQLRATMSGTEPAVDRRGQTGQALGFDGTGRVELPLAPALSKPVMAISLWFRGDRHDPAVLLSIIGDTETSSMELMVAGGAGVDLHLGGQSALKAHAGRDYADGAWHHLLLQCNDTSVEIHLDGVLAAQDALAQLPPRDSIRLGQGSDVADAAGVRGWHGAIDDLAVFSRPLVDGEKTAVMRMAFHPKDGAALQSFNGRLWLIGGWNPYSTPTTDNQIWSSVDAIDWRRSPTPPWEGRHTGGCLVHDGALWLLGGDKSRGHYQNEVWRSPDGEQWELVSTQLPWADRVLIMTASFRGRLWVMGGMPMDSGYSAFNDVYSSADGRDWRLEIAAAPWTPRGIVHGSLVFRDQLWVVGGGTYFQRQYFNDVWSSDDGVLWTRRIASAPWSGRIYHNVVVHDDQLWVVGGCTSDQPLGSAEAWRSTDGVDWQRVENAPWAARHAASVASFQDSLVLSCGGGDRVFNDVWQLVSAPGGACSARS